MYQMDESNKGGVAAKKGFFYQDYVATLLATRMLLDSNILGIGNEVGDDVEIYSINDIVTHVQVKTGTVTSNWNLTELKACRDKDSNGKSKPKSSILHKLFAFDNNPTVTSRFMMVTDKPVSGPLKFLEHPLANRDQKTGRSNLVDSINRSLGKTYCSGNGHKGDYWVDNTTWEVFASIELLILKVEQNLRVACEELFGVLLSVEQTKQLGELLCNKTYFKSQLCKKSYTLTDKTLTREEGLNIVESYVKSAPAFQKAYPKKELSDIVNQLFEENVHVEKRRGFTQEFNFSTYRFDHIAEMLVEWMDEVFLKPSELVGRQSSFNISTTLKQRISEINVGKVISKVILNSILRKHNSSQPIPMVMFAANSTKCLKFDSVNIVTRDAAPDEVWISINEFIANNEDVYKTIDRVCEQLNDLIFIDMDKDRSIILENKDDQFLFRHDIDEILDGSSSFSSHIDRFKFIIFLSYQYNQYDESTLESEIRDEITSKINYMSTELNKKSKYFGKIRLGFYLFPTPCNDTIIERFEAGISA